MTIAALMQLLQFDSRLPAAKGNSITHAVSTRRAPEHDNNHTAIALRSATRNLTSDWNYAQMKTLVAEHRGGTDYTRNDPSRKRWTQEVPFIAGRSHFTRKNTRFRAPPQHKAHATFMQPLQLFRSITSQTCTYLRTRQHQMTTITEPFQCDLQPQIQETYRTTHTGTTARCRTQRRNQNDRSRSRTCRTHEVPFIAGRSHFTRKNTRFRAPASSPLPPLALAATSQMHHAVFITTSLRHRFPSAPLPFVTISLRHHLP